QGVKWAIGDSQHRSRRGAAKKDVDMQQHRAALTLLDGAGGGAPDRPRLQPRAEGRARCTLRLLAERFMELGHVESISHATVRQVLRGASCTIGGRTSRAPAANGLPLLRRAA